MLNTSGDPVGSGTMSDISALVGSMLHVQCKSLDSTALPNGGHVDITLSYGLIYIGDKNTGGYLLATVNNGTPEEVKSKYYGTAYTLTRVDATHVRITRSSSNASGMMYTCIGL